MKISEPIKLHFTSSIFTSKISTKKTATPTAQRSLPQLQVQSIGKANSAPSVFVCTNPWTTSLLVVTLRNVIKEDWAQTKIARCGCKSYLLLERQKLSANIVWSIQTCFYAKSATIQSAQISWSNVAKTTDWKVAVQNKHAITQWPQFRTIQHDFQVQKETKTFKVVSRILHVS